MIAEGQRRGFRLVLWVAIPVIAMLSLLAVTPAFVSANETSEPDSGVGVAGPAIEFNVAVTPKVCVGVAAVSDPSKVDQQCELEGEPLQVAVAEAGDATGSNGGVAVSGPAIAGNVFAAPSVCVQVVAGNLSDGEVEQTGIIDTRAVQGVGALSGDAGADGLGSVATSGVASALNVHTGSVVCVQVDAD